MHASSSEGGSNGKRTHSRKGTHSSTIECTPAAVRVVVTAKFSQKVLSTKTLCSKFNSVLNFQNFSQAGQQAASRQRPAGEEDVFGK